jgi:hypothetical protein
MTVAGALLPWLGKTTAQYRVRLHKTYNTSTSIRSPNCLMMDQGSYPHPVEQVDSHRYMMCFKCLVQDGMPMQRLRMLWATFRLRTCERSAREGSNLLICCVYANYIRYFISVSRTRVYPANSPCSKYAPRYTTLPTRIIGIISRLYFSLKSVNLTPRALRASAIILGS